MSRPNPGSDPIDEILKNIAINCTNRNLRQRLEVAAKAKPAISKLMEEFRIEGLKEAKALVLRRTEIPADAKNPTRDLVVIIGEECAAAIDHRIQEIVLGPPPKISGPYIMEPY